MPLGILDNGEQFLLNGEVGLVQDGRNISAMHTYKTKMEIKIDRNLFFRNSKKHGIYEKLAALRPIPPPKKKKNYIN